MPNVDAPTQEQQAAPLPTFTFVLDQAVIATIQKGLNLLLHGEAGPVENLMISQMNNQPQVQQAVAETHITNMQAMASHLAEKEAAQTAAPVVAPEVAQVVTDVEPKTEEAPAVAA